MNIWFTADTHFSHFNCIGYSHRPFSSIEEMDETIFSNFHSCFKKGDRLYFLGDLTFRNDIAKRFFNEFSYVDIYFIYGNHDKKIKKVIQENARLSEYAFPTKIEKLPVFLSHYQMKIWDKSHFNSWNLYGHSHGGSVEEGKQMDVGVDTHNFFPYNFEEIKEIMKKKPDNFNLVKERE